MTKAAPQENILLDEPLESDKEELIESDRVN